MRFDEGQASEEWRKEALSAVGKTWLSTRAKYAIALAVLVLCGAAVFGIYWAIHVNDPVYLFKRIEVGMTYDDVVRLLGEPATSEEPDSSDCLECSWGDSSSVMIFVTFEDGCVTSKDMHNFAM